MPKKILIVDDEKDFVQCLSSVLTERCYEVIAAFDGLHAIMQATKARPDMVLLDIQMPAGGGIDVLEKIRKNIYTVGMPVMIITAKTDDEIKNKAEAAGISGYFVKPVDMAVLMQSISQVFSAQIDGG